VKTHARMLGARLLRRPRVVYRAQGGPAAVALTFDDGPSQWTAEIAGALEAHGCHGTFFLLGDAVERSPEAVTALARAGHELGNHLWSHADPERQTRAAIRAEIERTAAAIDRAAGARPVLVRPPYCGAPGHVARAASRTGVRFVVLRSVDPADWRAPRADAIVEAVLTRIGAGDIVCMHDGIAPRNQGTDSRAATAAAVVELVPQLLACGLRPVTVSELLA
jgi:peptidoglycan/xylan/chitin deacetylase (PgdA/CDA1 family)